MCSSDLVGSGNRFCNRCAFGGCRASVGARIRKTHYEEGGSEVEMGTNYYMVDRGDICSHCGRGALKKTHANYSYLPFNKTRRSIK